MLELHSVAACKNCSRADFDIFSPGVGGLARGHLARVKQSQIVGHSYNSFFDLF